MGILFALAVMVCYIKFAKAVLKNTRNNHEIQSIRNTYENR
jgi:hypothetical protein